MRLGATWPYDAFPQAPEATWDVFTRLRPDSAVIMSHTALSDYLWLAPGLPSDGILTVRAKTGPGHLGTHPSDILDYKEWEYERSLRDALETVQHYAFPPRVILGNEPDIEMAVEPVDNRQNMDAAIAAYREWWFAEAPKIREAFPGVQLSPAPLSQGNRDRFLRWASALNDVYLDADFLAVHCYIPMGEDPAAWGEQYKWWHAMYCTQERVDGKPFPRICITETNDDGKYGSLNDVERAERYKAYIESVAQSGMVDEVDVFTLPGGAGDASAPPWWFITPEMADVIGQANRESVPIEPEPVEAAPMTEEDALNRALVDLWNGETMKAPYNPESAMVTFWRDHLGDMGSACGPERVADSGNVFQAFARGVWKATPGDPWTVEKAA